MVADRAMAQTTLCNYDNACELPHFFPRYYKLHFTDSCYCAVTPKRNSLLHWLLRTSQGSDPDVQSLHSIFWWSLCRDLIPLIAVNPVDTSLFVTDSGPANLKWTWNIWVEPKIQGIHVARTGLWFFLYLFTPNNIQKSHFPNIAAWFLMAVDWGYETNHQSFCWLGHFSMRDALAKLNQVDTELGLIFLV